MNDEARMLNDQSMTRHQRADPSGSLLVTATVAFVFGHFLASMRDFCLHELHEVVWTTRPGGPSVFLHDAG